jgi:hypothetical protein
MRTLLGLGLALLVPSTVLAAGAPRVQGYTRKEIKALMRADKIPLTPVPGRSRGSMKMGKFMDDKRSASIQIWGSPGNGQVALVAKGAKPSLYPGKVVLVTERPRGPAFFEWGTLPAK